MRYLVTWQQVKEAMRSKLLISSLLGKKLTNLIVNQDFRFIQVITKFVVKAIAILSLQNNGDSGTQSGTLYTVI